MNVEGIMSPEPVTVQAKASIDRVMDLMDEHDVRHLVVLDDGGLAGVLSDRDVLDATGWLHPRQREVLEAPAGTAADFMRGDVVTVEPGDTLVHALDLFVERRVGCLPVLRGGALAGLVTEMDVLRAYADACRTGRLAPDAEERIDRYMTREPVTIAGDASGDEAAAAMREAGYRHLPVVEGKRLIGILSDRDVRRSRGRGQLELSLVRELMSPEPQTATPGEPLSSAALLLDAERISALPVVEGGELVGLATIVDVLAPCARALQQLT